MQARKILTIAAAAAALIGSSIAGAQATAPKKHATKAAVTTQAKPTTMAPAKSTVAAAKSTDSTKKTKMVAHKKSRKSTKKPSQ